MISSAYSSITNVNLASNSIDFPIELRYTFELDAEITKNKRVFLVDGAGTNGPIYETQGRFNLTEKNHTTCLNFSQIHVEVCTCV